MKAFITQELSPIKFCFFIKPNQKNTFHKCVKLSHSYWGGMNNPIFPLYKNFSRQVRIQFNILNSERSFYSNFISNHDPDIVIYQEGLDEEYVKEVSGDRELMKLSVFENETENFNQTYGVSVFELLYEVIITEFKFKRNDSLGISLPTQSTDIYTSIAYEAVK